MTGISESDHQVGRELLGIIEKKETPRDETGRFASQTPPPEAPAEPETVQEEPIEEAAPEADSYDDEIASPEETEPTAPAFDPPAGLSADEAELFRASPPEVQKAWARREQERNREFRTWQNKRAEAEKQFAEQVQALQQERQAYAARLGEYVNGAEAEFQQKFGDVKDPSTLLNDPMKFLEYQALAAKVGQARQQKQMLEQQAQMEADNNLARYREAENNKIRERLGLDSDAKASEFEGRLVKFLVPAMEKEGFDQARIERTIRSMSAFEAELVHDAMRWRAAQAKRAAAEQAKPSVPKVLRPGTKPDTSPAQERQKQALVNLRKTGRVEDAAAYFRNIV